MSTWRDSKLLLCVPVLYFANTRSPSIRHFAFDVLVPLVPAVALVVSLSSLDVVRAVVAVGLAYLAFISLYELGYLANDTIGTQKDETPRKRLRITLTATDVTIFTTVRLAVWAGIGWLTGWGQTADWLLFYAALAAVLVYHNSVESSAFKAISFVQLSVLRFAAPILPSVERGHFFYIAVLGLLFFTYHRFIVYLDAKARLRIPERKRRWYYPIAILSFAPLALFSAAMARSWLPVLIFGYFLFIHSANALLSRDSEADTPTR